MHLVGYHWDMPPVTPMVAPALTVGGFITFGWETFKKRPWFLIGATLLFTVIGWIAGFIAGFVGGILEALVGSGVGGVASFFVSFTLNSLVAMGWVAFFIKAHDDISTTRIGDFWHPQYLLKYIGTTILYVIAVFGGFLLLIVPGVIAAIAFMFALYLVVDKGLGPIEALKESARITKGNRLRLFALLGAITLVSLLGLVALVVGLLVAIPITSIAFLDAYRRLSAAADASAPKTPLTGGEIVLLIVGLILPIIAVVGIFASVFLASFNVAREKGQAARSEADLKMLQLGVELYREAYGMYPATLSQMVEDPGIWSDTSFLTDGFTYTPLQGSYRLCSKQPTASGQNCVTAEDFEIPGTTQ